MTKARAKDEESDAHNPALDGVGEAVRRMRPYQAGRSAREVAEERGGDVIKLSSNENPRGASPKALAALRSLSPDSAARYPDGGCSALRAAVARKLGVDEKNLVFGNGSNEILELAAQLVLTESHAAAYSRHAFAVYALATAARRARSHVAEAGPQYEHDLDAMAEAACRPDTRLVFFANPNNPTGTWHPPEAIEAFLERAPSHVIVVLDEAYREYVDGGDSLECADFRRFPNLIVTRTFSKIHGLAGLRAGFGVADAAVVDMLNRIRQPFNMSVAAQTAALAALDDEAHVRESVEANRRGMKQMKEGLANLGMKFMPSAANFVTFAPSADAAADTAVLGPAASEAARIYDGLLSAGVVVRPLQGYDLSAWLRVTVGTEAENEKFLRALEAAR